MSSAASVEQSSAIPVELLGLMPDAALTVDGDGTVLAANALALQLFGCDERALVGSRLQRLLPIEPLLSGGAERASRRLTGRRANGVPVVLDVSVLAAGGESGQGFVCCLRELNSGGLASEAQRYFDAAFDESPIGMALFNCDGEYLRVNGALCRLLGRSEGELLGRRDQELTHPDDRQADVDAAWEILDGKLNTHQCEKRFVRPDGSIVWALANLTFLRDEHGRPLSWVAQFQDITARKAVEEALRVSEERFRVAFDHAPIGLALVAPDGRWQQVNATLCDMTGFEKHELLAGSFQDITHPDDLESDLEYVRAMLAGEIRSYEIEKRYVRADGSVLWGLLSVALVRGADADPLYFISQIQDIGERKRAHLELERLARQDALTGALNRRGWDEELAQAIDNARRSERPLGIALLDLNSFKQLNDRHGHAAGDRLLKQAAGAWQARLRERDRLARVGGDEFAVLLPDCGGAELAAVADRLRDALDHLPGCAIGIAQWRPGVSADELARAADRALYRDKPRRTRADHHSPHVAGGDSGGSRGGGKRRGLRGDGSRT